MQERLGPWCVGDQLAFGQTAPDWGDEDNGLVSVRVQRLVQFVPLHALCLMDAFRFAPGDVIS